MNHRPGFLIILLLITIASCNSTPKSGDHTITITSVLFKRKLPQFVKDYLNTDLKGWSLSTKENWDDSIWKTYETDTSGINFFIADINCDGKIDFTGIFKDSSGEFAAYQIYSVGNFYIPIQLESYGHKNKLDFGLRYLDPETTFKHYDNSLQKFKCGAVERFNFYNNGKKIFYQNKGFFEIEVGQ